MGSTSPPDVPWALPSQCRPTAASLSTHNTQLGANLLSDGTFISPRKTREVKQCPQTTRGGRGHCPRGHAPPSSTPALTSFAIVTFQAKIAMVSHGMVMVLEEGKGDLFR